MAKVTKKAGKDGADAADAAVAASESAEADQIIYVTKTQAEKDLDIIIEAQKIRRDPARFMAAKALPAAQKHYIV